ncbi:hypothetical protein [Oricola cellulosilytica]|uniref:Uncharacterized protein n=1 Tax=Oricola cellulosilytica TaxID=1429082 RepID=A0A4R0PF01_9HYPH|nr:hypothetical protein [Oricola cellulosilytica]TCD15149.1 hypothetical protein E0D97_06265 [Oricola cellulosilytica]
MSEQDTDHGLDPAADTPPLETPGGNQQKNSSQDPTQGGRTDPIGGADGAAADLHLPDGIPDHLKGQSDQETIDKVWGAYRGARDELAKNKPEGKPEKPEAYSFEWPDSIKSSIAEDDKAVSLFREIAHEAEFTQKQIAAIPKFFEAAAEKGLIDKPQDNNALLESLAPEGFQGSAEEKRTKGAQRLTTADNWVKQLTKDQGYDDAMKEELRLLTTSEPGVRVLERYMGSGVVKTVTPGGERQASGVTQSQLNARVADPRNNSTSEKFDEDFAKETRELFKRAFPD